MRQNGGSAPPSCHSLALNYQGKSYRVVHNSTPIDKGTPSFLIEKAARPF
ncbi:hypothetical protein [Rufibacter tibetensis]|nr:hypothetical protein [Rufibacter tibetensis]